MGDADIQKLGDGGLERAESLFRSSSVINFFNTYMSCRFKMGMNIAGGSLKVQQQAAAFGISAQDMVDERCSAASSCSAAASNTRADKLDLFSSKTGLPDGMGMNIAGGSLKVAASNTRAEKLDLFSSKSGLPDGMGLKIAGGSMKVQQDAADLDISPGELVQTTRWLRGIDQIEMLAKLSRGKRNPNLGTTSRNAAFRALGEAVGSTVMGEDEWSDYIKTSTMDMPFLHKPFGFQATIGLAKKRDSGARDGWEFDHAVVSEPRWAMTDKITYRLPDHTEEVPDLVEESLRAAISDAYHHNWTLNLRLLKRDKKDQAAGKELSRSSKK